MNSMMWLSQALGGAARVWLDVAFVAGVILALLFRPERVRSWSLFQFGCGDWALSTIAPSLVVFLLDSPTSTPTRSPMGMGAASDPDLGMMSKVVMLSGPVLFALAFLCVVFSLMPSGKSSKTGQQ
jgi:hypothetical protein